MSDQTLDWVTKPETAASDDVMYVDVGGYEGPLDLLLDLARRQKVDLTHVSVLALAEQYLEFIDTIRQRRIEVAADYLVMAAWLAYLKSRLMVPQEAGEEEPSGEMMAAMLQFRLKRLEAMRTTAGQLMNRSRLGVTVFTRGAPEPLEVARKSVWEASLYDLLKAYGGQREREGWRDYTPPSRTVWGLQDAREILERLVGESMDWVPLDRFLAQYLTIPESRATVMASSFSASLEMARQGHLEIRQTLAFGPLFLRRRKSDAGER